MIVRIKGAPHTPLPMEEWFAAQTIKLRNSSHGQGLEAWLKGKGAVVYTLTAVLVSLPLFVYWGWQ